MKRMLIVALVLCGYVAARAADFPHPDRIRYDAQCLTIEGKDTLVFSGAFHYFRCPKPLWPERFAKIKEAGCNAVETYVAWNWHEKDMPASLDDFSKVDMTDLVDWMKMAHEQYGLYTIIRPGPYICAEWAGGGFPAWLMNKKPANFTGAMWLRSDDAEFLRWSKHWLDACNKVVVPEQLTRKPVGAKGVILYQIENEYDLLGGFTDAQRTTHVKSLCQNVLDAGIDVPIITCWTRQARGSSDPLLKNVFDGPNSYPRWNIENTGRDLDRCRAAQPNAPLMIPECQGGWFAQVGGRLSVDQDGVTAEQCNGISMMALAHGTTILNYYMFFGGTNFGEWASRTQPTTYD
jgi:Glycosyl hydrolases family 35